jgi:FkbM family methyltransferase
LVQDRTTIIDVGTNIGETLLNFAKRNISGVNIGFEPVPFLFEKAKHNIGLNHFQNIVLNNAALSNNNETLSFNIANEFNSGGIFLSAGNGDTARSVPAIRLDDYVSEHGLSRISLIKIDVEGFEMNVLQGAAETLKRFKPALFVEINDGFLKRQKSSARELFQFLRSMNYLISYAENGADVDTQESFQGRHFDIIALSSN